MNDQTYMRFFKAESIADHELTYVVVGAREKGQWIFVRHRERDTWELPAGHIEHGEAADEAAERELFEETGTSRAAIRPLNDYAVNLNGTLRYGRIFIAEVIERGPMPRSEIGEILIREETPLPATYPLAHQLFLKLLNKHVRHKT